MKPAGNMKLSMKYISNYLMKCIKQKEAYYINKRKNNLKGPKS